MVLGRLLSIAASLWLASILVAVVSQWLGTVHPLLRAALSVGFAKTIVFIVLAFILDRLLSWLIKFANSLVQMLSFLPLLGTVNGLLGALAGLLQGIIILAALSFLVLRFQPHPLPVSWVHQSVLATKSATLFGALLPFHL
jgi:uncharacterized membrane protein required for colicin V production